MRRGPALSRSELGAVWSIQLQIFEELRRAVMAECDLAMERQNIEARSAEFFPLCCSARAAGLWPLAGNISTSTVL